MSNSVVSQRQQSLCVTSTQSILHDRVITRAEEAKRDALILKTERLCSAERRRTNALLKRMRLPIKQEPLPSPQPPAGPRPRPETRVQERKILPVSHVTVLPPVTPVIKKPTPPTNRGTHHGTAMLHPQPPAGPRRPRTSVPGRKIISASDVASQLNLPFTEVITKPALPSTHETHHETYLQIVQPITIDKNTNYAAGEDLKCPEYIEREWLRMLRAKKNRQRDREERQRLAEENTWAELPDGRYTLAQIRPVAYIPQNDVLPMPKPYGALTPFKPSELGNLRHFRRPTLRPLMI